MSEERIRVDAPLERTREWMAYIDAELKAVCSVNGCRRQIRPKWSVRDKPVSSLRIDDYEWKIIPGPRPFPDSDSEMLEARPEQFEVGTYFVLSFVHSEGRFVLQHDTNHCGVMGDHWFTSTYTEIHLAAAWRNDEMASRIAAGNDDPLQDFEKYLDRVPPAGLLQRFLLALMTKFAPNEFFSS